MSQSIDVGSVLGGRYKVTSSIIESHDGDLVLDGVDQILNRPVSILVSAPHNSQQLAQSAREVATGERHVGIQVLDLGTSHEATYLITNHAAAADLLDLIVAQDAPYVEPFFTDTLGSEIFGESRSREPETYDGLYEHGDHDYIRYPNAHPDDARPEAPREQRPAPAAQPRPVPPPPAAPPRSAEGPSEESRGRSGGAPGGGAAAAAAAAAAAGSQIPNPPKVTPWPASSGTSDRTDAGPQTRPDNRAPATPASGQPAGYNESHREPAQYERPAQYEQSTQYGDATQPVQKAPTAPAGPSGPTRGTAFPAEARGAGWGSGSDRIFDRDDELEEDDESTRPKSVPWLVGGILAIVLIAALIFAFTTLGSVFQPQASGSKPASNAPSVAQPTQATPSPGQTRAPAPVVAPVIDSVSRLNPSDLTFADQFDAKLVATYDGNPASYWSDMEFAREDWGGFAKSVTLAVKLQSVSDIKQVELDQLGATGGSVSVYTNATPDLGGAALAGTSSFNGPQLVFQLPSAVKAQYVLIQINALPRLANYKVYPYGLRLAEIKVQ
ncbi:hypothetical protein [Sinomonas humi]|uniref:Uncharacterized protein n=1 Tax=Sinomonas humi TaxID=1338436 RepID=A0A0B2AR62_9MICC|nr:hypothetical protein [Sinomonas humi]KHL04363.1 hypothetical protein LK10_05485 [Sinomonas humi]